MQVDRGQGNCAQPLPNREAVGWVGADEGDREASKVAREGDRTDGDQLIVSGQAAQHDQIGGVQAAKQFVEVYGQIYGKEIPIRWVDWEDYITNVSEGMGAYCHFEFNMCPDISKLRSKLGYQPAYTPEQTLARAVDWMRAEGMV